MPLVYIDQTQREYIMLVYHEGKQKSVFEGNIESNHMTHLVET